MNREMHIRNDYLTTDMLTLRWKPNLVIILMGFVILVHANPMQQQCLDSNVVDVLGLAIGQHMDLPQGVEIQYNNGKGYRFRPSASTLKVPATHVFRKCNKLPNEFSIIVSLKLSYIRNDAQYLFSILARDHRTVLFGVKLHRASIVVEYHYKGAKQVTNFIDDRLMDSSWHMFVLTITRREFLLNFDCQKDQQRKLKTFFPIGIDITRSHIFIAGKRGRKSRYTGYLRELRFLSGGDFKQHVCRKTAKSPMTVWSAFTEKFYKEEKYIQMNSNRIKITEEDMGTCSSGNMGELIYTKSSQTLDLCLDNRWMNIVKGPRLNYVEEYSSMKTKSKTLDIEIFKIPEEGLFMATANQGRDKNMDSAIYKWDGLGFVSYQNITTNSAQDWEYFSIGDDHFLAVANQGTDERTPTAISVVYRWSRRKGKFLPHQFFTTIAAQSWKFFTIRDQHFIAIANYGATGSNGGSKVLLWDSDHEAFVSHQSLDTIGGVDFEYFEIEGQYYLAVANSFNGNKSRLDSVVYKWSLSKFIPFQYIETVGAHDFEFFKIEDEYFLAVANYYDYRKKSYSMNSNIYKLNSRRTKFAKIQSLATFGALDLEYFEVGSDKYLIAGTSSDNNKKLNNVIYKWQGVEKFLPVHNILSRPCADWEYFVSEKDQHFLVSANLKGKQNNIYKLKTYN